MDTPPPTPSPAEQRVFRLVISRLREAKEADPTDPQTADLVLSNMRLQHALEDAVTLLRATWSDESTWSDG